MKIVLKFYPTSCNIRKLPQFSGDGAFAKIKEADGGKKDKSLVADKEELLLVLDKNGKSTDKLEKRSVVHDKCLFHNEVALWILRGNEVLLQRRSPNKKHSPNKLGLCAGHVVGYDSLEDTLKKETSEEIGLDLTKYEVKPLMTLKRLPNNNYHFSHHYYIKADIPLESLTIQKEELTEVLYKPLDWVIEQTKNGTGEVVFTWNDDVKLLFSKLKKIVKNNL